ncbi:MAG: peroxidase [Methylobacteriaceae bacterium]|nr:peroxidase [Methylobacteriaceae bacterium]
MPVEWYEKPFVAFEKGLNRFRPWHRWPFLISLPMLVGIRARMRWSNLFDTERTPPGFPASSSPNIRSQRTADGSYNDLNKPWMGMKDARFGRNVPLERTFGETPPRLFEPNPREVSNRLLARKEFVPVPFLNVFVSSWLQFMVHDWLSHGENLHPEEAPPYEIPIEPGDTWPVNPMTVLRSRPAPAGASDPGQPTAYTNIETHWWDSSQIYGSTLARQMMIRTDPQTGQICPDGKIGLKPDGHLPLEKEIEAVPDAEGVRFYHLELTGVNGNWWVGLSAMHTLFAREHNCIVDRLKLDFPQASGEWLFQKARLIVAALIAKIHTIEWTPALMNSPEGKIAMRSNWWGLLGEHYARAYGRLSELELVSGIPGSPTEQHAAPYAMTEEFTACYRMHPLMPDEYSFRSHVDNHHIATKSLIEVARRNVPEIYDEVGFENIIYSLGTSNPGALVLHNYPNQLRMLPEKSDLTHQERLAEGFFTDLAAVDILRDRERGVPRYCEFRRQLGMSAPATFEELTDNPAWREEIKALYPTVEDVDLLVGTLAEKGPPSFGFSDTVFRIFILMASRRLKSDRFFTTDFTPEVYTQAGWEWIQNNTFRSVLTRHCPSVAPLFEDVRNVFFPWAIAGSAGSAGAVQ